MRNFSDHATSRARSAVWPQTGIVDAATRLDPRRKGSSAEFLLSSLDRAGVAAAIVFSEVAGEYDACLAGMQSSAAGRLLCVPHIDVFSSNALEAQQSSLAWGCRAIALSAMGSFQSPVRRIALDSIESTPLWRVAAETGQLIVVEPSVDDAHFLPLLAAAFPSVRVLVRGGLISRMAGSGAVRTLPSPDRFTFDRLHQLENVWVQFSPANARRVRTSPPGTPGGWHAPSNLLCLFSNARLLWGSEHLFDPTSVYQGPGDPNDEIPELSSADRVALMGGVARRLLQWI